MVSRLIKPSDIKKAREKEELPIGNTKEREISFFEAMLLVALIVITPVVYQLIMSEAGEKRVSKKDPTEEKTHEKVISEIKDENVKQLNPATDIPFEFSQADGEDIVKQVMDALEIQEMEPSEMINNTEGATNNTAAMSATHPARKYTVQVGAFQTEKKARKIMMNLASKGYPAFVETVKNSREETWWVIRIGSFQTREWAELYGDELEKREPLVEEAIVLSATQNRG